MKKSEVKNQNMHPIAYRSITKCETVEPLNPLRGYPLGVGFASQRRGNGVAHCLILSSYNPNS